VEDFDWVCDPFGVLATFLPLKAQEELMNVKADRTLQLKFHELSSDTFWLSAKEEYPVISKLAVRILLPFSITYLYELGFSTLKEIKTSKRKHLRTVDG
jgi:hypothetical protein